jgi:hypothetical protein
MLLIIFIGIVACFQFQELLKGITLSHQSIIEKKIIDYSYIYQEMINLFYNSSDLVHLPKFYHLRKNLLAWFREAPFHRQLLEFTSFLEKNSEGLIMDLKTYPVSKVVYIPIELRELFPHREQQFVLSFYLGNNEVESSQNSKIEFMNNFLFAMIGNDNWKFRSLQNALSAWRNFLLRFDSCAPQQLRDQISNDLVGMVSLQGGNAQRIQIFVELYYNSLENLCMGDFNFGSNLNSLALVYDLIIYYQNISRIFNIADISDLRKLHIRFVLRAKEYSKDVLKVRKRLYKQPFNGWLCNEETVIPQDKSEVL